MLRMSPNFTEKKNRCQIYLHILQLYLDRKIRSLFIINMH